MTKITIPKHPIQKHIVGVLTYQKYSRFKDMRPPKADTNLYSYHLKALQQAGFVFKTELGYTLGKVGLAYVDRHEVEIGVGLNSPQVVIRLVVQNGNGDILIQRQQQQPFIDDWSLPGAHMLASDRSLVTAAKRVIYEQLNLQVLESRHAGDCYVRISDTKNIIMSQMVHVVRFETDNPILADDLRWARPHRLGDYVLTPITEQVITRAFFNDPYFFEEFTEDLRL